MTDQVGRYRILSQLGKGAMGVVYLAEDPVLHRQVAIKTVELETADAEQRTFLINQLFRDARAAAQLTHPNIVGVYDVLEQDTAAYLVMEYVPGETLADQLRRGPIAPDVLLRVLREMAAALDYVHKRGIIHRDIKPANVMIDQSGTAKIMDFGIARISDSRTTTPTGMVLGTIEYMSPEHIKGEGLDGRTDQFALAAVAYSVLCGGTMYGPLPITTLIYKIIHEMPAPVKSRNPDLPAAVDTVLSRALHKEPTERFPTCTDFVNQLQAAFTHQPETEVMPITAPTQRTVLQPSAAVVIPAPAIPDPVPASRMRQMVAVVSGLALALVAVAGTVVWKSRTPHEAVAEPAVAVSSVSAPKQPEKVLPPAAEPVVKLPVEPSAVKAPPFRKLEPPPPPPAPAAPEAVVEPVDTNDGAAAVGPGAVAFRRGRELLEAHRYEAAVGALNEALKADPKPVMAYLTRGNAHQALEQYQLALNDYNELLRTHPKNAFAIYQRGVTLAKMKRDNEAIGDFENARNLRPRFANPYMSEGMYLLRRQNYQAAISKFDRAIELAPNLGRAYEGRAKAKEATGDRRGAAEDFRKAREIFARDGNGRSDEPVK